MGVQGGVAERDAKGEYVGGVAGSGWVMIGRSVCVEIIEDLFAVSLTTSHTYSVAYMLDHAPIA